MSCSMTLCITAVIISGTLLGMIYLQPKEGLTSIQHMGLVNVAILPELLAGENCSTKSSFGSVQSKEKLLINAW